MGTRGIFGFIYKGRRYIVYNHFDSYPSGLGLWLLIEIISQALPSCDFSSWIEKLEKIHVIREEEEEFANLPEAEQQDILSKYGREDVGFPGQCDWYQALRDCQGSFVRVLDSGYLLPYGSPDKPMEDLKQSWIEYSYILNLDTNQFESYATFSQKRGVLDVAHLADRLDLASPATAQRLAELARDFVELNNKNIRLEYRKQDKETKLFELQRKESDKYYLSYFFAKMKLENDYHQVYSFMKELDLARKNLDNIVKEWNEVNDELGRVREEIFEIAPKLKKTRKLLGLKD